MHQPTSLIKAKKMQVLFQNDEKSESSSVEASSDSSSSTSSSPKDKRVKGANHDPIIELE